jgi:hypothetical protein
VIAEALPARTIENNPTVVAIGVDCRSGPNRPDLTMSVLASHGYWVDTGIGRFERMALRHLHHEQQARAGLAASALLGDPFLNLRAHLLRNTTMPLHPQDGQENYEYVQFRHCALIYRASPSISIEYEDCLYRGEGMEALMKGVMAVGYPADPIPGHELLRDIDATTKMARDLFLRMVNDQCPEHFDDLVKARVEIAPPVITAAA